MTAMTSARNTSGPAAIVGRIPWVPAGTRATRWLIDHGYLKDRTVQVLEFPKSGGTWLARLIATTLEWPFLDDTPLPPGNSCVLRGHAVPTPRVPQLVYLVRDPRDVYVSLFHHRIHHWSSNSHYRRAWLEQHSRPLSAESIRTQMPDFLTFEHSFAGERGSASPVPWAGHVRAWETTRPSPGRRVLVSYEALRKDTPAEIMRIYNELCDGELPQQLAEAVAQSHSLKLRRDLTAHAGVGRSFIRSGTSGGWADALSKQSGQILEQQAGPEMRRLGYTHDTLWWHDLDD